MAAWGGSRPRMLCWYVKTLFASASSPAKHDRRLVVALAKALDGLFHLMCVCICLTLVVSHRRVFSQWKNPRFCAVQLFVWAGIRQQKVTCNTPSSVPFAACCCL